VKWCITNGHVLSGCRLTKMEDWRGRVGSPNSSLYILQEAHRVFSGAVGELVSQTPSPEQLAPVIRRRTMRKQLLAARRLVSVMTVARSITTALARTYTNVGNVVDHDRTEIGIPIYIVNARVGKTSRLHRQQAMYWKVRKYHDPITRRQQQSYRHRKSARKTTCENEKDCTRNKSQI